MKKLMIFTDAWHPQVNGVVTTLTNLIRESSCKIKVINPTMFKTIPCPGYSEISLSMVRRSTIIKLIKQFQPDYIHISTEGPIGFQAFRACKKLKKKFTTSYHTRFPEYINGLYPWIKTDLVYNFLRKIHKSAEATFIPTNSIKKELMKRDICNNYVLLGRGVDKTKFPFWPDRRGPNEKPILLYVGRISKEKNIEAFIEIDIGQPVEKRIVGKGPYEKELKEKYADRKEIVWVGEKNNSELAREYQKASVLVFPSKTDTFGLVMLEAMATGTPVAGFYAPGPKDLIIDGINGYIARDGDLSTATRKCLDIPRNKPSIFVSELSWKNITRQFELELERVNRNSNYASNI